MKISKSQELTKTELTKKMKFYHKKWHFIEARLSRDYNGVSVNHRK